MGLKHKPTLIMDEIRVKRNIARMAAKARASKVNFRPHFKTHQSAAIGEWFRDVGVKAITVSSVVMAEQFAQAGWRDITVAVPVNLLEIDRINELAGRITLHVLVDSALAVEKLISQLNNPINLWIKIDVGYHRCGLLWYAAETIIALAQTIDQNQNLTFKGLLTHAGHTYYATTAAEVRKIHRQSLERLNKLKQQLQTAGIPRCKISIGDTPGCNLAKDFTGADEIRPGNFVFHDLMQLRLGACQAEDLALAVECPVIGKYPQRSEIVIFGGAVHLSKEYLTKADDSQVYGYLADDSADGWGAPKYDAPVISLSQEHGIVQLPPDSLKRIEIGDTVLVLPVHACLTANLYREYLTTAGQQISRFNSRI
ncbi:MAG: alanine racemase [Candidatus Marinimicrobia bacterium]|nr:alanine racemase [Candidatus Neomarinimicrobiota bacterium]